MNSGSQVTLVTLHIKLDEQIVQLLILDFLFRDECSAFALFAFCTDSHTRVKSAQTCDVSGLLCMCKTPSGSKVTHKNENAEKL